MAADQPLGDRRADQGLSPRRAAGDGHRDAYGHAIHDWHRGLGGYEIVERDDGFIGFTDGPWAYFASYRRWPAREREAIRAARGRVLDVGCGAGRAALHLEQRGHEVVAIDSSPLAVSTCRHRGVRDVRCLTLARIGKSLGTFDTIIMFGNNFGLLETPERAKSHLRRLRRVAIPGTRILAESTDLSRMPTACHQRYVRDNRARGLASGQSRIRVRYLDSATPWFDYLLVSREEMSSILTGTGWSVERTIDSDDGAFVAVIRAQ